MNRVIIAATFLLVVPPILLHHHSGLASETSPSQDSTGDGASAPPSVLVPPFLEPFREPIEQAIRELRQEPLASPDPSQEPATSDPVVETQVDAHTDPMSRITQLRETLRLQPDSVRTRVDLGDALYHIGDLEGAIEYYRDAIRRDPQQTEPRVQLATALMVKHEWAAAREELESLVTWQPDLAQAHYALGTVRYTLGDHAGAIEAYRQVLQLRPEFADVHYYLGLVLKLANQDAQATYEFLAAALSGVPKAQYFVGEAYAGGLGVERHLPAAIDWWLLAAEHGVPQAKEALAQLRRTAVFEDKHQPDASRDARQAFADVRKHLWRRFPDVTSERRDAETSIGVALLQQERGEEAIPVLIREASALSEPAQSALETLFDEGASQIDPHNSRILAYWKTTAEEGLPRPRLALARIYTHGLGVRQDLDQASRLLQGLHGEQAKALLKEIAAMQQRATALQNAKPDAGPSP